MQIHFSPFDFANHTAALYELLKGRQHSISHSTLPSYQEHESFCRDHPYREWLMIYQDEALCGSVYLTKQNAVGINLKFDDETLYTATIEYVLSQYQPLPAIASVVPNYFYINVAPGNRALKQVVEKIEAKLIQHTYKL